MDLFDDDKRLTLRPVAAFNELLAAAFANGKCTCIGCEESGGSQDGYAQAAPCGARHHTCSQTAAKLSGDFAHWLTV